MGGVFFIRMDFMTSFEKQAYGQNVFISIFI